MRVGSLKAYIAVRNLYCAYEGRENTDGVMGFYDLQSFGLSKRIIFETVLQVEGSTRDIHLPYVRILNIYQ